MALYVIANPGPSDVTVDGDSVAAEEVEVIDVGSDAFLADFIDAGCAAMPASASYEQRRTAARRLAHSLT